MTIGVSGALAALAANRVASLSNWAFRVVPTAETYISCRVAIPSARRTRQRHARRNAGVRYVGQADFAHSAVGRYIALHAAVQGEVTSRVSKVQAIGAAHARNAGSCRRIRQRAMQAQSSAVALVVALAERDTRLVAVGGSCIGNRVSVLVAARRVRRRVSGIRDNRPVGAWGHASVSRGIGGVRRSAGLDRSVCGDTRVAVFEVHDQRVAATEAGHGDE